MASKLYPRCINDIFGYCKKKGILGEETTNQDKTVRYYGSSGTCEERWQECKDYIKFTELVHGTPNKQAKQKSMGSR